MALTPWDVWHATEELSGKVEPAPFWAHTWPGCIALARQVMDQPEVVRGKRVLDFGAGCGLAGIAAAKVGAAAVEACEVDATAAVAIELNSALNGVSLTVLLQDLVGAPGRWDVVLAGDVFYNRFLASRIQPWLDELARAGTDVLLGDPGRSFMPWPSLVPVATYDAEPVPEWDSLLDRPPGVWRLQAPPDGGRGKMEE